MNNITIIELLVMSACSLVFGLMVGYALGVYKTRSKIRKLDKAMSKAMEEFN